MIEVKESIERKVKNAEQQNVNISYFRREEGKITELGQ